MYSRFNDDFASSVLVFVKQGTLAFGSYDLALRVIDLVGPTDYLGQFFWSVRGVILQLFEDLRSWLGIRSFAELDIFQLELEG